MTAFSIHVFVIVIYCKSSHSLSIQRSKFDESPNVSLTVSRKNCEFPGLLEVNFLAWLIPENTSARSRVQGHRVTAFSNKPNRERILSNGYVVYTLADISLDIPVLPLLVTRTSTSFPVIRHAPPVLALREHAISREQVTSLFSRTSFAFVPCCYLRFFPFLLIPYLRRF